MTNSGTSDSSMKDKEGSDNPAVSAATTATSNKGTTQQDDDASTARKRPKHAPSGSTSSGVDTCSDNQEDSESAVPASTAGSSSASTTRHPSSANVTASSSVVTAGDYLVPAVYNDDVGSRQQSNATTSPSSLSNPNILAAYSTGHGGANQLASYYEEALLRNIRLQLQAGTHAMPNDTSRSLSSMLQHPSLSTGASVGASGRSEGAASLLGLQPNSSSAMSHHQALLEQARRSLYASLSGQSSVSSSTSALENAIYQQRMNALMLERMRLQRILQLEQQRNQLYNNPMGLGLGTAAPSAAAALLSPAIGIPLSLNLSSAISTFQAGGSSRAASKGGCLNCLPSGVPYYKSREVLTLSHDNDPQTLSDYLCFIRKECLELFVVTEEDVESNRYLSKVQVGQCGIRCRFCAHIGTNDRFRRSTAFPSSIRRIYQSITMMLREHFPNCIEMPPAMRLAFAELKANSSQGTKDAKRHWVVAAAEIGMTDNTEKNMILLRDSPHQIWYRSATESTT